MFLCLFRAFVKRIMAGSDTDSDREVERQPRKRVRNHDQWRQSIAKQKRARGEAYVSRDTNKLVEAREIGPPCSCPKKCFDVVGEENIQRLFKEYYSLGDRDAQSHYIHKCVSAVETKRKRTPKDVESRRKNTRVHSVFIENKSVQVCKQAFVSIHGITEGRVRCVLERAAASGSNILPDDQRGRQPSKNKTSDEARDFVVNFINALPTCSSHYSRAKSPNRVYMPPNSSRASIYKSYCKHIEEEDVPNLKVSNFIFQNIFREFNIGIEPLRTDTCNYCDEFKIKMRRLVKGRDDDEIANLKAQRVPHIANAQLARKFLKTFKKDTSPAFAVVSMDLQQTLPTPRLSSGAQYYKRKLWTYNFCVHDAKSNKAYLYVWNEVQGKRGSAEVCSCLDHFVHNYLGPEVQKLAIFSDNCGGQNKNKNIVLTYLRWVHAGKFNKVEHHFMEPGHSHLSCDGDFGNLEQKFKVNDVYTTPHYIQLMEECRSDSNPFTIIPMGPNTFYDFGVLENHVSKAGLKGCGFKNAKRFLVNADNKKGIKVCSSFGDYFVKPVDVKFQKGRGKSYDPGFNLSNVQLPLKYPSGVKIKSKKIDDLKDLVRFIPESHIGFYNDLFASQARLPQVEGEEEEEDHPDDEDEFLDY